MVERIVRADDITDEEGAEPVEFTWAGINYVIDLVEANRKKFEDAISLYVEKGRARQVLPDAQRATRPSVSRSTSTAPKKDYTSLEYAGLVHRGKVTDGEADLVRANLKAVNANRAAQEPPQPPIDPENESDKARYHF